MKQPKINFAVRFAVALSAGCLPACAQENVASNMAQSAKKSAISQTTSQKAFVHPGLLHTEADFTRMKAKVEAKQQPWLDGWNQLASSRYAQLNWNPRPTETIVRGNVPGQNVAQLFNDVHAAYQLALRWKVSGDSAYADKALAILNGWGGTLKTVGGNADRFLAAGIYGYEFANAAEIMRTYSGWQKADFEQFQQMMLKVFYPMNKDFLTRHNTAAITNYWANWDLCNISAMQAIGVLCDRRDIYDEAMNYLKTGGGNGAIDEAIYYVHRGNLGQWQEAGRDQGHTTLGIALMGPILETAWNQGDDFYSYDNNRFLAGAEYVAKYNLGSDVPFQLYAWGIGQKGDRREQPSVSGASRGHMRAGYELVINHYMKRKGIAAPWSEQYAAKLRPEGSPGGHASAFDQLGFGTLTETIEAQVQNPKPSGLVARKNGGTIDLSWWGAAGAEAYNVKRATKAAGPYRVVASDVKDLLACSDKDLEAGTYFYIVAATKNGKETTTSDAVKVTTGAVPQTQLKFDQKTGTKAVDSVQDAHAGILNGGASWEIGKDVNAVALNGRDGYLALPEGITKDLADFSVAAWVYLNDNKPWTRVFDFGDDRGRYLFLTSRAGNGKLRFSTSTVYNYNEQFIDGDAALPTGRWVHVAVTLSGRVGTLYVDGVAVGSNPNMDFPPFQIGNTPRNWIGRSQFPNDPYLNGKVDDFRIYDGALNAEQVAAIAGGKEIR